MPKARKECVSLDATPYYHCVSRCVRRAFLCGTDQLSNTCYEHRREWLEQRIIEVSAAFSIDVCAYAVMSNHYHIVVQIDADATGQLSTHDILSRWTQLFSGPQVVQQFLHNPLSLSDAQRALIDVLADTYRLRLCSLSWFMRCINESIARQANDEDNCSGHFWESRFKSQALLDEAALLSAMAYVDLNPMRAKMADTPEKSQFTSVYARLSTPAMANQLLPFTSSQTLKDEIKSIPFTLEDYLELVDWTGRAIRHDKRGHINNELPPILERLNINPEEWIKQQPNLETNYPTFIGSLSTLKEACDTFHRKWVKGRQHAQLLFQ